MNLCAPALIYLVFSLVQIIINIFNGLYNTALMNIIIATLITSLLNILCINNLKTISWLIVFIPFIFMTIVTLLIVYIFSSHIEPQDNIIVPNVKLFLYFSPIFSVKI